MIVFSKANRSLVIERSNCRFTKASFVGFKSTKEEFLRSTELPRIALDTFLVTEFIGY